MQKPKLNVVNRSVEVQNEWPNVPLAMNYNMCLWEKGEFSVVIR